MNRILLSLVLLFLTINLFAQEKSGVNVLAKVSTDEMTEVLKLSKKTSEKLLKLHIETYNEYGSVYIELIDNQKKLMSKRTKTYYNFRQNMADIVGDDNSKTWSNYIKLKSIKRGRIGEVVPNNN